MARNLRTTPPTSSVARLLDPTAAARAIQKISGHQAPSVDMDSARIPPPSHPALDRSDVRLIKREVVLTPETDAILNELVDAFRRATCTRLSTSHVVRAILLSAHHVSSELQNHIPQAGSVRLPSNARGRDAERQHFELLLARAFANAIRQ